MSEQKVLQSWKEIALYMNRGVRTVQRWEHYGLPIHRPAGRSRSAVLAMTNELDGWIQSSPVLKSNPENGAAEMQAELTALREENQRLRERLSELETKAQHFAA